MLARLSSPAAERKIWLSKFPRANIIRAVRLLPEAVRVGAAAHSVEEEQEERVSSPPAAQRKEPDELKELQEEVQRLTSALRDAERENRDLAARVTLSEKELSKEKERLAA
jgi:predicted RNase H-like nuclease (RuvC/YqgF family)